MKTLFILLLSASMAFAVDYSSVTGYVASATISGSQISGPISGDGINLEMGFSQ